MIAESGRPEVCVVDDDGAVRDSLETYLVLKGFAVTAYSSPGAFLVNSIHDYCVLIVDVNMPDMDGFSLLEALRRRGITKPAIFVTGLGDDELRSRALQAGAAAFFDKPIDVRALLETVRTLAATE
jgi:FixJ family two-component response regulator